MEGNGSTSAHSLEGGSSSRSTSLSDTTTKLLVEENRESSERDSEISELATTARATQQKRLDAETKNAELEALSEQIHSAVQGHLRKRIEAVQKSRKLIQETLAFLKSK